MQWKPHKIALLVFLVIFFALAGISCFFSPIAVATDNKEIGPNEVQGKIIVIEIHQFGKGVIVVTSDQTGVIYKFYVGYKTAYITPRRYPSVGDTIKVSYITGYWGKLKATRVETIESPK
jgi:hypothetical protein